MNSDYRTCAAPSKSKNGVWGGRKQRPRLKPWRQGGTAWHQRRVRVEKSAHSRTRTISTVDCCAGFNPTKKHVCTGVGYIYVNPTLACRTNGNHICEKELPGINNETAASDTWFSTPPPRHPPTHPNPIPPHTSRTTHPHSVGQRFTDAA